MIYTKEELDKIIHVLQSRYKGKKVFSIAKLASENLDLDIGNLNAATKRYYGKTRQEYLTQKGILEGKSGNKSTGVVAAHNSQQTKQHTNTTNQNKERKSINSTEKQIEDQIRELCCRYPLGCSSKTLAQLSSENPDLSIYRLNHYAVAVKGSKLHKYVLDLINSEKKNSGELGTDEKNVDKEQGKQLQFEILESSSADIQNETIQNNSENTIDIESEEVATAYDGDLNEDRDETFDTSELKNLSSKEQLEIIADELQKRYKVQEIPNSYVRIIADNKDLPMENLNRLTQEAYNITDKTFLKSRGLLNLEHEKSNEEEELANITFVLERQYKSGRRKEGSLEAVRKSFEYLKLARLNVLTRKVCGVSATEYLEKKKLIEAPGTLPRKSEVKTETIEGAPKLKTIY